MIRCFTSYYLERDARRNAELLECLNRNLESDSIDEVNVILEGPVMLPLAHAKLHVRQLDHRPTYTDYMRWACEYSPSESHLTILANSDIFFDHSIEALASGLRRNQCAALTRWNTGQRSRPELFNRNDSQDAWVFKGALRPVSGDYCVGVPRCDNRFLHELKVAGYEVINPAFSVRAYHLHEGVRAEYHSDNLDRFVAPPYAYLWPHNLWSLPRTLLHNLRHPGVRLSWRMDRRKLLNSLPARAVRKAVGMASPRRGTGRSL